MSSRQSQISRSKHAESALWMAARLAARGKEEEEKITCRIQET